MGQVGDAAAIHIAGDDNFALAAAAGFVVALAGAAIWSIAAYDTGYSFGYLALLIGIGVGLAVRGAGQGDGPKYRILGASLAALGWVLGIWLCGIANLAHNIGQPFVMVLGSVDLAASLVRAVREADGVDILVLAIAVLGGYRFAGASRSAEA